MGWWAAGARGEGWVLVGNKRGRKKGTEANGRIRYHFSRSRERESVEYISSYYVWCIPM